MRFHVLTLLLAPLCVAAPAPVSVAENSTPMPIHTLLSTNSTTFAPGGTPSAESSDTSPELITLESRKADRHTHPRLSDITNNPCGVSNVQVQLDPSLSRFTFPSIFHSLQVLFTDTCQFSCMTENLDYFDPTKKERHQICQGYGYQKMDRWWMHHVMKCVGRRCRNQKQRVIGGKSSPTSISSCESGLCS